MATATATAVPRTFLFSVWGHPRITRISKKMDASCRRKATMAREPGNGHDRFAVAVLERNIVHSWTLAAGNIQDSF